ncbi:Tn3 family transposase [Salmonella enterica]|nr:Tn3 family transposase [Salmonella enterica]
MPLCHPLAIHIPRFCMTVREHQNVPQKECIQHLLPLSTRTDRGILIAEESLKYLHQRRIHINDQLLSHLSPLGWEHINLMGDYIWRNNKKLAEGKYRSLRPVDVS